MDLLTYATFRVVIDTLAWLNAVNTVGGDAPEEDFKACMLAFKEETAEIIEELVLELVAEQAETPTIDPLPFEEEE